MNDNQPPSYQKILVIRFSSIGDIVLTTPVVRSLKKQLPGVSIHYLTKKSYQNVIEGNPYIDKLHTFTGSMSSIISELKAENFDFVVDLQNNARSHRITGRMRCSAKSFPKHNIRKLVLVCCKMNFLPERHIVDRYFEAVKPLGITNDGMGLDFFIPDEYQFDVHNLPAGYEEGYIAVAVGATWATKRIPAEKIVEISSQLFKPVILLGGKDDMRTAEEIVRQLEGKAINYCGQFPISTTASIVAQSDCVLTADTGIMHIAAALRKPIASLWGNTVPEFGMYPYIAPGAPAARIFEMPNLKCRPCSKLGFKKCPHKHFKCMREIATHEVADWINQF